MRGLIERQQEDIRLFKEYISEECTDFFKNRKRIKVEIQGYAQDIENKSQKL